MHSSLTPSVWPPSVIAVDVREARPRSIDRSYVDFCSVLIYYYLCAQNLQMP